MDNNEKKAHDPFPYGGNPKIAILGTLPGNESIKFGEYYKSKRNDFWKILFCIFEGTYSEQPYLEKGRLLKREGIILWDVLHSAQRSSSKDNQIIRGTEVPNNFRGFLEEHQNIELVLYNGKKAEEYTKKLKIQELLMFNNIATLSSSSRSNWHNTCTQKRDEWEAKIKDL